MSEMTLQMKLRGMAFANKVTIKWQDCLWNKLEIDSDGTRVIIVNAPDSWDFLKSLNDLAGNVVIENLLGGVMQEVKFRESSAYISRFGK